MSAALYNIEKQEKFFSDFFQKAIDKGICLLYTKVKLMIMIIINNKRAKQNNLKGGNLMATLRNSKQRDAVLKDLQLRYDHPTAEDVYLSVKKAVPSISLATVYRNLKLLESEGLILRIPTGDSDRYDGHTHNHYHFTCKDCRKVLDLDIADQSPVTEPKGFDGTITGHSLMFFGLCSNCNK